MHILFTLVIGGGCAGGSYSETKDCCTSDSPCSANKGDCDSDNECAGDLRCGSDNCGTSFTWTDADCCFGKLHFPYNADKFNYVL